MARCTAEVVREHGGGGGEGARPVIGFCFSFPTEQTALDNGRVMSMTKASAGLRCLGRGVPGCRPHFMAARCEVCDARLEHLRSAQRMLCAHA